MQLFKLLSQHSKGIMKAHSVQELSETDRNAFRYTLVLGTQGKLGSHFKADNANKKITMVQCTTT